MRRIITFLLISLLALLPIVGCSNSGNDKKNQATSGITDSAKPVATDAQTKTPISFKYWVPFVGNAALFMKSWDDNMVYLHKEKKTGVKINFLSPSVGDEVTAFNLMISSAELPDMIQFHPYIPYSYPGGPSKAVKDGVILKLNDLIAKYAPNFTKVLESNPDFKRQVMTDDGTIWGMGMLETENQTSYMGPTIREDWLKELNLPIPKTVEDWRNVLTAFKEKKGATAPWILRPDGLGWSFPWAYDIDASGWLKRDDKIVYSFTDPGFLEYLTEMNKWYKEGLVSKDFTTADQQNKLLTNGGSGAYDQGFWMFSIDEKMIKEKDAKVVIAPVSVPTKDANGVTKIRILEPNNRGFETVITKACKNPEEAVKWLDWNYSEAGYLWNNFGEEGVSYTMVDGKPKWTEFMTKNPKGFDLNQLMNKYTLQSGSYVRDWKSIFVAYSPAANLTLTMWDGDSSHLLMTRLLTFTADEGNINATVMGDIGTYVSEMTIKFIKGQEPLANWDKYLKQVESMGLNKVVTNYQAAYDRYLNRK